MDSPSFAALQPGTKFHQRYCIVRCIKTGAMGAVYEVADETTNSRRALKVMLPGAMEEPDLRARFALEAKITGGIESDHIVRILDAGIDDDSDLPFLVMELLRGEDLGTILRRRGPLPPADVVIYLHQMALALDKMHAAGIVHRDLKPDNIFLTARDDGSPCIKILDFGIAKLTAQSSRTLGTVPLGTPLYMSPEQVRGDGAIGPPADLYTLGHIAYGLLAGEAYWKLELRNTGSLVSLFLSIAKGAVEPPTARAAARGVYLPQAFDAWFAQATAPRPEERFGRARAMVVALAEALDLSVPKASSPALNAAAFGAESQPGHEPAPRSARGNDSRARITRIPLSSERTTVVVSASVGLRSRRVGERAALGAVVLTLATLASVALAIKWHGAPARSADARAQEPSVEIWFPAPLPPPPPPDTAATSPLPEVEMASDPAPAPPAPGSETRGPVALPARPQETPAQQPPHSGEPAGSKKSVVETTTVTPAEPDAPAPAPAPTAPAPTAPAPTAPPKQRSIF